MIEDIVRTEQRSIGPRRARGNRTSREVKLTKQTREAIDAYMKATDRLISYWIVGIGLNASFYGAYSLRRTKATLIYRRTSNLRAVQLLLGHRKIEGTVRCLGIEIDNALAIAERVDV